MANIKFYTLLYLSNANTDPLNTRTKTFKEQRDLYIKNAMCLGLSLRNIGYQLNLITNASDEIQTYHTTSRPLPFDVVNIDFSLSVPPGIRFYAAHRKIDVFKYFASQESQYSILVDSDVVFLKDMSPQTCEIIENNLPLVYSIGNQRNVSKYTRDLLRLDPALKHMDWYGGEIIGGSAPFFRNIIGYIDGVSDRYFKDFAKYDHQGDEVLVSAALNSFIDEGVEICDVSSSERMLRFWSEPVGHRQGIYIRPLDYSILHLPADKAFLSQFSNTFDAISFDRHYRRYLWRKIPYIQIKKLLLVLRPRR